MKEEGEKGSRPHRGGSPGRANVGLLRPVPSSLPLSLKQGRFTAEAQKRPRGAKAIPTPDCGANLLTFKPHPCTPSR